MGGSSSHFHKAVLYAGGGLAEIYPVTAAVPKVLLGIYDKPLVYYSLSVLLLAGIRQVAVITAPMHQSALESLLGSGRQPGRQIISTGTVPGA
jgi:glucose-1-phosphate thymidylyltransferase